MYVQKGQCNPGKICSLGKYPQSLVYLSLHPERFLNSVKHPIHRYNKGIIF